MNDHDSLIHSRHDHRNTCARTSRKVRETRSRLTLATEAVDNHPQTAKRLIELAISDIDRLYDELQTERQAI